MTNIVSVQATGDQDIDGLLSEFAWDTQNLSFSFPTSASYYGSDYGWNEPQRNFQPFNDAQIAAARKVFAMIAGVTNLTFTETEESETNHATLRLAESDALSPAWTYLPHTEEEGGDSWFRTSSTWFDNPIAGGYGYLVFIHEILHAVGLKHGHETTVFGAMTPGHDSMEYSVTTYRSYVGASGRYLENEQWGFAQTLMMYDIAALQHIYGADFTTHSDDTSYRWSSTTGELFINGEGQGAPGANKVFMTVWDGGGVDTYDFSSYKTALTIDLRPGEWSRTTFNQTAYLGSFHFARGNVANALLYEGDTRSLIENAIGGRSDDRITGNEADNLLKGLAGYDLLVGLEGNDTLRGGSGNDTLTGGDGEDVFVFAARPTRTGNLDRITDFAVADDTIYLENAVFTRIGKSGKLPSSEFWVGSRAHDFSDRIIYDKKSGALYYDPDGIGWAAPIKFAVLTKGLALTARDFWII